MTALPSIIVLSALGFVIAFLVGPSSKVTAAGAAVSFAMFAAFSVFGFIASGEPGVNTLAWRFAYSIVFLASTLGVFKSGRSLFRPVRSVS